MLDVTEVRSVRKMSALTLVVLAVCASMVSSDTIDRFCLPGWILGDDQCYYFGTGTLSWDEAADKCYADGGYLAEINNESENNLIKNTLDTLYGGSSYSGAWVGATQNPAGSWMWYPSTLSIRYEDWASADATGACVSMSPAYDWQWEKVECTPSPAQSMIYVCEMGYVLQDCHGDSCYTIYEQDLYTYIETLRCEREGETFARIETEDEMEFIRGFLTAAEASLTSDVKAEWDQGIFISGFQDNGVWYFGTPYQPTTQVMTYFDWATGGLDLSNDCIALDASSDFQWRTEWCNQNGLYLCEIPNVVIG